MVKGASTVGASGLTLTDALTRQNIAKGTVSPTFISTITGKKTYRGVVQADAIMGRNLGYLSGHYSAPSSRARSSHTTSEHAGKMTTQDNQLLSTETVRVKNKIGWIGLAVGAILIFILVKK